MENSPEHTQSEESGHNEPDPEPHEHGALKRDRIKGFCCGEVAAPVWVYPAFGGSWW